MSPGKTAKIVHRLDPTLHEKSRLSIATTLSKHPILSFIQLKNLLGMTDGNLCVHMKTLERKGYLHKAKEVRGGRPQTVCELSENGKKALRDYLSDLEKLVSSVREAAVDLQSSEEGS